MSRCWVKGVRCWVKGGRCWVKDGRCWVKGGMWGKLGVGYAVSEICIAGKGGIRSRPVRCE